LRHFDAAIRRFPDYYEVYYHQGIVEMQLGNNEEAKQRFQKAIDPSGGGYARAEFGFGLVLLREGKANEAERLARHGLQEEPDSVDGHVVLGSALLKQNRLEEAKAHAREALQLNGPNSAKGYLVLSDVNAATGNYAEQVRDLDSYLKVHPNDPNRTTLQAARDLAKRFLARGRLIASK
jgi:tetratricopeptide (TPR) repeat protein